MTQERQRLLGNAVRVAQGRTAAWNAPGHHPLAKDATLDWLLWYNRSRMHSTFGYLSPAQFEQQADARQLALAA
ncbi:MAG: IS3 family transposase [Acidobacteriaceae bacterium]